MSVNYDGTTQTARLNATLSRIDNHISPASLEICTASYAAVLCIITLSRPSFSVGGSPPSCALTMLGVPKSGTAIGSGVAALARIKDGSGIAVINGLTVGTTGADINLNSVNISTGQSVTVSTGTITHSP